MIEDQGLGEARRTGVKKNMIFEAAMLLLNMGG